MNGKMGAAPPPTAPYTTFGQNGLGNALGIGIGSLSGSPQGMYNMSPTPTLKKHQKLYEQIERERERRIEAELGADKWKAFAVIAGTFLFISVGVLAAKYISDYTTITCTPEKQLVKLKD